VGKAAAARRSWTCWCSTTTRCAESSGGDDAARAYAQQGIDVTNSAYDNSQINARVRLAGRSLISFFEDGKAEDELVSFQADPTAADLRQAVSADLGRSSSRP